MLGTMKVSPPFLLTTLVLVGCTAAHSESTSLDPESDGQQMEISSLPDYPVDVMPTTPVSPQFVLEHRSALHGKTIRIRGTVLRMIGPDNFHPGGGVTPLPGGNPQPRLFLAAGPAGIGEPDRELMLLLREGDKGVPEGEIIEVDALVEASRVAVVATRIYPAD